MFGFLSSKKNSGKLTLPPLGKKSNAPTSTADDTFELEGDVPDNESIDSFTAENAALKDEDDGYDYSKPDGFETWIRAVDDEKAVYWYNVKSGESAWLGPCATCCKPSSKYCIDCKSAFCDPHFKKRHEKKSRQKHHWQIADPPNVPKIRPEEVFCIECSLNVATLMCTDCWDAYCANCFKITHRIGVLRFHPTLPYEEARKGWIQVRGASIKDADTYVNGTTGVTTYEKPVELMNPLERKLHKKFKRVEALTAEAVSEIEQLQFDVEQTKFQRDRTWEEAQATLRDLHTKNLFKEQQKEGNQLDHSKLKGGGFFSSLFGNNGKEEVYRDKLLNPTNRRRGESRTNYIKDVLATAAGIKTDEEEEGAK
jgi:hypothetical protein